MPYTVSLVDAADIPVITTIQWSALRDNPLILTLYPRGPTRELANFTTASYEKARTYSCVRIVKATDDETGQIVGFAKWIIYHQNYQESGSDAVENGAGKGFPGGAAWSKENPKTQPSPPHCYTRALDEWNRRIAMMRKGIISRMQHSCMSGPKHSITCYFACFSKNLYVLDILHTHPSQQGKGAGACLVKWGTDIADKAGSLCYVETPAAGYSLFRKSGFQAVTEVSLDLGKFKDNFTEYKHFVMVRPSYGLAQQERPPPIPPKNGEQIGSTVEEDLMWETSSGGDGEESPALQYTAEARMLDLRDSNSTRSARVGSIAAFRASASMKDLRSSASTGSGLNSIADLRTSSSVKDLNSSLSPKSGPVEHKRASMREMSYSLSTQGLRKSASWGHEQAVR